MEDARQLDLFDEQRIPDIVKRIWRAADRHYATGTTATLTRERLQRLMENDGTVEPSSLSTIDRARRSYARFVPWPIRRGMRRPWGGEGSRADESDPLPSGAMLAPDGRVYLLQTLDGEVVEAVVSREGVPLVLRLASNPGVRHAGSLAAALLFSHCALHHVGMHFVERVLRGVLSVST